MRVFARAFRKAVPNPWFLFFSEKEKTAAGAA
ncbi:hypothetical protein N399_18405 [Bacillus licheniformis CG-B52]|nr:hypothetical protein N399_18405 [Bacillus licheniformis CG-B52]KUL12114.1 hypothetical protein LI17339_08645 [Bacillus licheniformis LMG 17339]